MKRTKARIGAALAVIAVIIFPLGVINFIAAESDLTHVFFHDGDEILEFRVAAETVGGFLNETGIETGQHDRLSHNRSAGLWDGIEIVREREVAFYVSKNGGDAIQKIAMPGRTVEDVQRQLQHEHSTALVFAGDTSTVIENGDVLSFDTFHVRHERELFPLPYQTLRNHTSSVSQGRERLRIPGEYGEKAVTTAVLYVANLEESRDYAGTEILREPVDAILDIGTGWLGALADVTADDFHYYRRIRMEATAYTSGYSCTGKHPCDPWYGITASGRRVEHGIVAVDRNVIPLGTRLYVENHGFSIAADVGGAIRGNKIDLFMYDIEDAIQFGRRHLYVWILDDIN